MEQFESIEAVITAFAPWQDKWGMVTGSQPPGTSGNGLLFTAEYAAGMTSLQMNNSSGYTVPWAEHVRLLHLYNSCEIQPGLYQRSPDNPRDQESFDDYYGIATYSRLYDQARIERVKAWAKRESWLGLIHKNYWNNIVPDTWTFSSWLGRNPALMAVFSLSGIPTALSFWERLSLCVALLSSLLYPATNTTSWALGWHLTLATQKQKGIVQLARKMWQMRFAQLFPGGLGELRANYYGNQNHPIKRLMWQNYGDL